MKIGILRIGQVDSNIAERLQENLAAVFPDTTVTLITKPLPVPKEAFNETRQQHRSNIILRKIHAYAEKKKTLDRVLGIVNVDIYAQELNFVFGEAEYPGKAALISLWRLRPEFYGKAPNTELPVERSAKEAVHEIGHTLGLQHCSNPFCAMYFSNSTFETDRKQSLFCSKCYLKIERAEKDKVESLE
jgi:archaemetzincin